MRKTPSEIFKSLDYLNDDVIMHNMVAPFRDWDMEGLTIQECAAISVYIEFSTNDKPFADEITKILFSDAELTKPFRIVLGAIVSGELKRRKHQTVTKAGRDLWVYLAIEYAMREDLRKYTDDGGLQSDEKGLFYEMALHLKLNKKTIETAYDNGKTIYQDSPYHDAIQKHFKPLDLQIIEDGIFAGRVVDNAETPIRGHSVLAGHTREK